LFSGKQSKAKRVSSKKEEESSEDESEEDEVVISSEIDSMAFNENHKSFKNEPFYKCKPRV
jgi:hypothetical protein